MLTQEKNYATREGPFKAWQGRSVALGQTPLPPVWQVTSFWMDDKEEGWLLPSLHPLTWSFFEGKCTLKCHRGLGSWSASSLISMFTASDKECVACSSLCRQEFLCIVKVAKRLPTLVWASPLKKAENQSDMWFAISIVIKPPLHLLRPSQM